MQARYYTDSGKGPFPTIREASDAEMLETAEEIVRGALAEGEEGLVRLSKLVGFLLRKYAELDAALRVSETQAADPAGYDHFVRSVKSVCKRRGGQA